MVGGKMKKKKGEVEKKWGDGGGGLEFRECAGKCGEVSIRLVRYAARRNS